MRFGFEFKRPGGQPLGEVVKARFFFDYVDNFSSILLHYMSLPDLLNVRPDAGAAWAGVKACSAGVRKGRCVVVLTFVVKVVGEVMVMRACVPSRDIP